MSGEAAADGLMVSGQVVGLRALVIDRLRRAIVTGRFPPGSHLRERELCELTGVSRPSLREALRQLEAEGLITSIPHRGPTVAALTVEEVGHLYEMRRVLESYAAREFARLRLDADLDALGLATTRLNASERGGSPLVMLEAGSVFYTAIAMGSGNPYVAAALETLHNRIKLIRFIALHRAGRSRSFTKLRELARAIRAGDEERAERVCTEQLASVGTLAKAIVEAGYRLPVEHASGGTVLAS